MDDGLVTCPNCGNEVRAGTRFCSHCGRIMTEAQSSGPSTEGGNDDFDTRLSGGSGVVLSRSDSPPPPPRYDDRPQYSPPPPPRYEQEFESSAYSPPRHDQLPVPMAYNQPVVGFQCPYCRTTIPPVTRERVSQTGWIVLALLIIFCLPLFWIGLLIKEPYRVCSQCANVLS